MSLNAPTQIVFIISVVIALIGLLMGLGVLPFITFISAFWVMTVAFVVLAAACILKGA